MYEDGWWIVLKIIVAKHAGFCFGVKRAVELAEERANNSVVFSLGPLIHNPQEMERLAQKGIHTKEYEHIRPQEAVLIRAHGVGPKCLADLRAMDCAIIDATCPFVKKAQELANQANRNGYQVIILGDPEHAEVKGIKAWTDNQAHVVKSLEDLRQINLSAKVALLAQTTEKEEKFAQLVEYLEKRVVDLEVLDTICSATRLRQEEAVQLAKEVDVMVIVGGKHSSNTQKLWEVCSKVTPSYLVEKAIEIEPQWFRGKKVVGITAGASTPAWIIEEVIKKMNEIKENNDDQDDLREPAASKGKESFSLSDFDEQLTFQSVQAGDKIKGTVVIINNDEVLVDIGGKSEGILPVTELAEHQVNPFEVLTKGQEITVEVLKEDKEGNIILSRRRVLQDEVYAKLQLAQKTGAIITAKVIDVVKSGLLVDLGIRGFVPSSQIERTFVEDLSKYLGQELRLKVIDLDLNNNKVVLSQKVVLQEEYQVMKANLLNQLEQGQTVKGIVKRLASFGAFVDIGGIDGLLHISEIAWGQLKHPSQQLEEGQEIEVVIRHIDREIGKVSLSLKQLRKSPWEIAQEKYHPGMVVEGNVNRITPFGAFVELEPNIEGLVHISHLSLKRINKAEEAVSVGQPVKVKVLEVDPGKRRISLSIKEVTEDKEKAEIEEYMAQRQTEDIITIKDMIAKKLTNNKEN